MLTLRKAEDRGYADHGWLKSFHSFSFADYVDPAHMGVGNLRVINEDRIAPGTGFGTHSHRDMEIVSYVLEGALGHKDSIGNGASIVPGEVQRMSAGTGIAHSEFNHAANQTTHFLQIWLLPNRLGIAPGYEQKAFAESGKRGRLLLVAAPDGRDGKRYWSFVLYVLATRVHVWDHTVLQQLKVTGRSCRLQLRVGIVGGCASVMRCVDTQEPSRRLCSLP